MHKNKDLLSNIQITVLISLTVIGAGMIKLPRLAVEKAGLSGVFSIAAAGIPVIVVTVIHAILNKRFPGKTILEYSEDLIGKLPAKALNGLWVLLFVSTTGLVVRVFAGAIKVFLLENTPLEVIIISMLVVSVYVVQNGINPIARLCEAFFPIVIIAIGILLLLSMKNVDIKEFYSLWQINVKGTIRAMPVTILSYLGAEVLLFVGAFMMYPNKMIRAGVIGVIIPIMIYTATVIVCIGVFSIELLEIQIYPMLELAKSIIFPGSFAERFDIFFAVFWIIAVFTSVISYFYLTAISITKLVGMKNYRPFCYLLLPIIYSISVMPQNLAQVADTDSIISYFAGGMVLIIPSFLLIVSIIRKKGGKKNEQA